MTDESPCALVEMTLRNVLHSSPGSPGGVKLLAVHSGQSVGPIQKEKSDVVPEIRLVKTLLAKISLDLSTQPPAPHPPPRACSGKSVFPHHGQSWGEVYIIRN